MFTQLCRRVTRFARDVVRRLLPSCFAQERKCTEEPRRCCVARTDEPEPSERRLAFQRRCMAGPNVGRRQLIGGAIGLAAGGGWRIDGSILFGAEATDASKDAKELPPPEGEFTEDIIRDLVGLTKENERMLRESKEYRADLEKIAKSQGDHLGRMFRLNKKMDEIEGYVNGITAKCKDHREMVMTICKEAESIRQMNVCFEDKKKRLCTCVSKAKQECKKVVSRGGGGGFDWGNFFRILLMIFLIVMFVMLIVTVTSGAGGLSVPFFRMPKPRDMEMPGPERKFKIGPRRL